MNLSLVASRATMLSGSLKTFIHRKRKQHHNGVSVVNLPQESKKGHAKQKSGLRRWRSKSSTASTSSASSITSATSGANIECPEIPCIPMKRHYEVVVVACGIWWNPQLRFKRVSLDLFRLVECTGSFRRRTPGLTRVALDSILVVCLFPDLDAS